MTEAEWLAELERIVVKARAQLAIIDACAAESQRLLAAQRLAASVQPRPPRKPLRWR